MWPALRMATEKNVRRRARLRLLLLLRLRSLEDVRARERSDDDDVWRVARGRRADGATASGSADRRSEERGERESDLQRRRRSPALPPSSRESSVRVRLALSSLPSPESVWPRGRRREEARASPRRPPPPRSTGSFELTTTAPSFYAERRPTYCSISTIPSTLLN